MLHDDDEIVTGRVCRLVPSKNLTKPSFPSVPDVGRTDFAGHRDSDARPTVFVGARVDDEVGGRCASPSLGVAKLRSLAKSLLFSEPLVGSKVNHTRRRLLAVARRCELLAASGAAALEDLTSSTSAFPSAEAVGAGALATAGLIRTFRHDMPQTFFRASPGSLAFPAARFFGARRAKQLTISPRASQVVVANEGTGMGAPPGIHRSPSFATTRGGGGVSRLRVEGSYRWGRR